tara:strand:+ start:1183 stop:1299 length:117 start_codon:yes stop_codon:yes gene_type:complete
MFFNELLELIAYKPSKSFIAFIAEDAYKTLLNKALLYR